MATSITTIPCVIILFSTKSWCSPSGSYFWVCPTHPPTPSGCPRNPELANPELGISGFSSKYRSCRFQVPELQNPEIPSSGFCHGPELGIAAFSLKCRRCRGSFPKLQNPEIPSLGFCRSPELGISGFYHGDRDLHQISYFSSFPNICGDFRGCCVFCVSEIWISMVKPRTLDFGVLWWRSGFQSDFMVLLVFPNFRKYAFVVFVCSEFLKSGSQS